MHAARYAIGVLIVVLAAGCRFIGQTPAPSLTVAPTGSTAVSAEPTVSAPATIATPTPSATTTPVAPSGQPSLPPIPTASPIDTPDAAPAHVWRRAADFPPPEAIVRALTTGGPGFVAVGAAREQYECDASADGRIWTSPDGEYWTEIADDEVRNVDFDEVVSTDSATYAFGRLHSSYCSNQLMVFKSEDGTRWDGREANVPEDTYFGAMGSVGDTLIAAGSYEEDGYGYDAMWTSTDGVDWHRLPEAPSAYLEFSDVISLGDTVVAVEDYGANVAWYSSDRGQTWRKSDFAPLYEAGVSGVASGNGQIVGAASACCTTPDGRAGVTFSSTDGRTWAESATFAETPSAVVALPEGFLTIGRQNWISRDGLSWSVGPAIPDYDRRADVTALASELHVFVLNGDSGWFARTHDMDPDAWTEPPRDVEMPDIGVRYPVELFLHCGWPDIHFGLRPWLPDPPIDDVNPPKGLNELDRGWLTQVDADELQYQSRRGRIVTLRPSDEPQVSGPCA